MPNFVLSIVDTTFIHRLSAAVGGTGAHSLEWVWQHGLGGPHGCWRGPLVPSRQLLSLRVVWHLPVWPRLGGLGVGALLRGPPLAGNRSMGGRASLSLLEGTLTSYDRNRYTVHPLKF